MQEKKEILKKEILKCIDICNKEMKLRESGFEGESSIEQIKEIIIPELYQLLDELDNSNDNFKERKYLISFAYAFKIWNWNMEKPTNLYTQLTKINNIYKNM